MSVSYWDVDNVVQIGESKVSIPSENGLSYSGGQKVSLFVPPSVGMMDGKNSYIEMDVKLALPAGKAPTLLQLDEAGCGTLFRNIRIYDGTRGNLIEELNEYSNLITVRYDYDSDASKRELRALEEGGGVWSNANRGTKGGSKSEYTNTIKSPWFTKSDASAVTFTTAKVCIPLHTGIFSGSIFPVAMSNGLYIEIDLNPAARVIKQLDQVLHSRRLTANLILDQILETGSGAMASDWVNGSATQELYIQKSQNIVVTGDGAAAQVERCPFVVGETLNFAKLSNGSLATLSGTATISEINSSDNGELQILLTNSITQNSGENIVSGEWCLVSTSAASQATYDVGYTVSNLNLIVHQVQLDPSYMAGMLAKAREGKAIEFDIHTVTNYKNSLLQTDRQTSFLVHANNSRAKSLIVQPCDSSIYTSAQLVSGSGTYEVTQNDMDFKVNSNRSGMVGICDFLSSVQFQIDGKLVPSRPISTRKCATRNSIDAFHLFEIEKGLDNAGIVPRSFRKYLDNWILSRGFAIQNGAMDLRGKDLSVLLKYEEVAPPTKNKIINSFVFHVRRLVLRGSGAVEVIQ